MKLYILIDYDFLEELVQEGQLYEDIFLKDGLCFANSEHNPDFVYVFHILDDEIWATYGYARVKNKSFLQFHRAVEKIIFAFNKPIYRIGKNNDFKNHTRLNKIIDGVDIYEFIKKV